MHTGNQLKPQNYDINTTNFCTKTSEDFKNNMQASVVKTL